RDPVGKSAVANGERLRVHRTRHTGLQEGFPQGSSSSTRRLPTGELRSGRQRLGAAAFGNQREAEARESEPASPLLITHRNSRKRQNCVRRERRIRTPAVGVWSTHRNSRRGRSRHAYELPQRSLQARIRTPAEAEADTHRNSRARRREHAYELPGSPVSARIRTPAARRFERPPSGVT